jgi:hypothetical protein
VPKPFKFFTHRKSGSRLICVQKSSLAPCLSRRPTSMAIYNSRSNAICRICAHLASEHVGFPGSAAAEQLSQLYSGCLDCTLCANEF